MAIVEENSVECTLMHLSEVGEILSIRRYRSILPLLIHSLSEKRKRAESPKE